MIVDPTRDRALLDHILVSDDTTVVDSGTVINNITDHDLVYVTLDYINNKNRHPQKILYKRCFNSIFDH